MEKLAITLVGQGPDTSLRLKTMSYAPFALKAYLDSHLPTSLKNRVRTEAIDFSWEAAPSAMISRIMLDDPDIVGFSVYLWNYSNILKCAQKLKSVKKEIVIVVGGPQVSPIAEEVMAKNPYIDIISSTPRNGEITLLDIVETVSYKRDFNTVNGICYRDNNGNIVKTSIEVRSISYEASPSPYNGNNRIFDGDIEYMAVIEASRGCPFDCGYCFWGHGKRGVEYFPLKRVLKDIEIVYNNPKVKHVYFADSDLISNTERAETIIKHITKQSRQITTDFEINCIYLKESTAKIMATLPGFQFTLSLQSANPNALKCIGRGRASPEVYAKTLGNLKRWVPDAKHKVDVMLGLPGDDLDGFIRTLDFVLSLEPSYIVLSYPVYLLPGSRFFENREAWKLKHSFVPPFSIIETPTFPQRDIEKALRVAIWVQIFTYYYPIVSEFFYNIARSDGIRIQRILKWIEAIEEKIDLFGSHKSLTDVAIQSTSAWNSAKKDLLERASTTEAARAIYFSICKLEKSAVDSPLGNDMRLGSDIFEYMAQGKKDAMEYNSYESFSSGMVGKSDSATIKSLFSVYRR